LIRSDDYQGGIRLLTLDRPPANAISNELLSDLNHALNEAQSNDQVRVVVLTGAGKFFCGGVDLGLFGGFRDDPGAMAKFFDFYRAAHLRLLTFPKPTIAMVNGHAIAGGLILALTCDWRICLEGDHRLGITELAIGAPHTPTSFEIVRLRLGHRQARELLLGARLHSARDSMRLGIADFTYPADRLEAEVMEYAEKLAEIPTAVFAHSKDYFVRDAAARIRSNETPQEVEQIRRLFLIDESIEAQDRQRKKLNKGE
jgi:enoyl-CoA hydratase